MRSDVAALLQQLGSMNYTAPSYKSYTPQFHGLTKRNLELTQDNFKPIDFLFTKDKSVLA